jgi:uncharacterized repeat protein (TIGR03833 family)
MRPQSRRRHRSRHIAPYPKPDGSRAGGRALACQGEAVAIRQLEIPIHQNQCTGKFTEGIVKRILTKSPSHRHGIKVMLEDGIVGRVKEIAR